MTVSAQFTIMNLERERIMKTNIKIRIWYLLVSAVLVLLGLLSRKLSFIPYCFGDALWAMVVYCCWRIILVNKSHKVTALSALITSYIVEISQLIRWNWLVSIRATFLGHLLLGQGFQRSDLLAYTVGIVLVFLFDTVIMKYIEKREEQ